MAKTSAISVRVSDETKRDLERLSKEDGRSLASYVERILLFHLEEKKNLEAEKTAP